MEEDRRLISSGVYKRLPDELKKITALFDGREKDIVLLSSLGVLSSCLPNVYGIYDRDTVYPHLYVVIIAPAASGKGVMNFSRILIEKIHTEVLNRSKAKLLEWEKNNKQKDNKSMPYPNIQVKILPANISTSEMYTLLDSSKEHGVVMIESEADTIGNSLKNDWSNYSDVLRKVFHHEPISISRKMEKIHLEIPEPKMAMVVSGTPDQLKPLVQSRSNGLFSRLLVYNFSDIADFKDVFDESTVNTKQTFQTVAEEVYLLYNKLLGTAPVRFSLTDIQKRRFLNRFKDIREDIIINHSFDFLSSLHRHGLIMYRLCMILTILRNKENIQEPLICTDKDYAISDSIMKTVLSHAQYTFNVLDNSSYINPQEQEILKKLEIYFTRAEAIQTGETAGIGERTMDNKLIQWAEQKLIEKMSHGKYRKIPKSNLQKLQ